MTTHKARFGLRHKCFQGTAWPTQEKSGKKSLALDIAKKGFSVLGQIGAFVLM
jgi:hypothetical protein